MSTCMRLQFSTFLDVVAYRASDISQTSSATAFTFLEDGDETRCQLTYRELDHRARSIAAHLQRVTRFGDRVIIVCPPGIDYILSFLGCIYAGVVAVPSVPPTSPRTFGRLRRIVQDCEPCLVLASKAGIEGSRVLSGEGSDTLSALDWLRVDDLPDLSQAWTCPPLRPQHTAFLQYTSGSTGEPKGVVVSHENLIANSNLIEATLALQPLDVVVSWLPPYHDMGLIGTILCSIHVGCHSVQLSPSAFLRRPYRWLKAISDYRAKITVAPNFAYELCAQKISQVQKNQLDLSSLRFALNGAESIKLETVRRFSEEFLDCGFSPNALIPVYGLAEAT